MKYLLFLGLIPSMVWANYQKPELLARYFSTHNYNLPQDSYCYMGTPMAFDGKVIVNCVREEERDLMMWDESGKSHVFYSTKNFLSTPQYVNKTLTWYEYELNGVNSVHQWKDGVLKTIPVEGAVRAVSFLGNEWIFQGRDFLNVQTEDGVYPSKIENISYVHSPSVSNSGEYAVKIRRNTDANSSPDEIWTYGKNGWIKVFGDTDSDPQSPWKDFRNNVATGNGKVFVIARDSEGEALLEISGGKQKVLARAGVDLKEFESFQIAYNKGTVVFRGIDLSGRKVIYAHDGQLKRVLTQGDTVITDLGTIATVNYKNKDSIIYNNPTIGPDGEIVIQGTLTDFDDNKTLVGVGIIRIKRDNF